MHVEFKPTMTAGEEVVHFQYRVAFLLINATHFQWWQPDEETPLPFKLTVSGITRPQCRPDLERRKPLDDRYEEKLHHAFCGRSYGHGDKSRAF